MSCLKASIPQIGDSVQELVTAIENAPSSGAMMLAAWRLARLLAVKLVKEELAERAQRPTKWPPCEKCGKRLESKDFVPRQLTGLIETVRWQQREGRCPDRCKIGQVTPLDKELGLQPNQRTSAGLRQAACALTIFVPFEIAAMSLRLPTGVVVSPGAAWNWVQGVGQVAMTQLEQQLAGLQSGKKPEEEKGKAAVAALPLLIGADGFNHLLHLRLAWVNGRFDDLFSLAASPSS